MTKQDAFGGIEREVLVIVDRVRRMTIESAHTIDPTLSIPAYSTLFLIWRAGSIRAQAVAAITGADKATVSRQVSQLEELGLVTRALDPEDRRAQLLSLSPTGKGRMDALVESRRSTFAAHLADWDSPDLDRFVRDLHRFNTSLDS